MNIEYLKIRLFCRLLMSVAADTPDAIKLIQAAMDSPEAEQMTLEAFQSVLSSKRATHILQVASSENTPDA